MKQELCTATEYVKIISAICIVCKSNRRGSDLISTAGMQKICKKILSVDVMKNGLQFLKSGHFFLHKSSKYPQNTAHFCSTTEQWHLSRIEEDWSGYFVLSADCDVASEIKISCHRPFVTHATAASGFLFKHISIFLLWLLCIPIQSKNPHKNVSRTLKLLQCLQVSAINVF